ncbi:MAG: TetR/AcrR family transcriptional regulator C-terminal domain-containing protein [Lachnospiraceae bacterium]|nr:TetR/AcrR family transcriptional regulator C-terminal domain-containing protein [Lachnospiraceae bacterium]
MTNLTKKAIKEAFLELLSDRPLHQITIKDIVEKCGINRNSFYYHYQDMPALIEEIITEEADAIINEYPSIDSVEIAFNVALEFARKNRTAILHIYNSVNRDIFEQYLWKVCDYAVTTFGERAFANKEINTSDKEVISNFYKCEFFGFAINWLQSGMKEDVSERISRVCELQHGMLEETINRCSK